VVAGAVMGGALVMEKACTLCCMSSYNKASACHQY
jgi:hypothetical protein